MSRLLSRRQLPIVVLLLLVTAVAATLVVAVDGAWPVALVLLSQALVLTALVVLRAQVGRIPASLPIVLRDQVREPLGGRLDDLAAQVTAADDRHAEMLTAVAARAEQDSAEQLAQIADLARDLNRLRAAHDAAEALATRRERDEHAFRQQVRQRLLDVTTDAWSMHNLLRLVDVRAELPAPGGWAVTPQTLLAMVSAVQERTGEVLVVECGSGTSTVWLAAVMRQRGAGRVVAVEHDEDFAEVTREHLRRNGLEGWGEVRAAPLAPVTLGDDEYLWYDRRCFDGLDGIDLLLVDGPPWRTGDLARYPAVPVLADRLADGGLVLLDDVNRDDEKATARRWMDEEHGGRRLTLRRSLDRSHVFEVV